jgi:hypothetical protein
MVQMGNMGLLARSIRAQFVGAVDLIVQVERHRDGKRQVTQVTDVCGLEGEPPANPTVICYPAPQPGLCPVDAKPSRPCPASGQRTVRQNVTLLGSEGLLLAGSRTGRLA